ncbi:signal transduction histidine kinase [Pedobacter sp. CAN_A7]|uniref:ATP-binding protein n=1 Tax=Pedobacter sp. CAN_A7 TaxID=2787722 RepID=UPI0018CAC3F2
MKVGKIVVLFVLLFSLVTWKVNAKSITPMASNGTIDLRMQSLSTGIPLNGQWEFHWKVFLDPDLPNDKSGKLVDFPFRWTDKHSDGTKLPSFGYATYRVRVLLPANTDSLSMKVPDTYSAYKLFINGKLVSSNGIISTSAEGFRPYWRPTLINIPPGRDTLQVTLHIANFAHYKGGISQPLLVGKQQQLGLSENRASSIDLLLTGCLLMAGIFFMGLYLVGNRDKTILFFALFCLLYSYRIIGVDNYLLHSIFPGMSWHLTVRLEYISLFLSIGVFSLYTRYLYPQDIHKVVIRCTNAVCFSFTFLTLALSPYYFTQLLTPFLLVATFCIFYIPYIYTIAYRRKRSGAIYTLMSALAIVTAFAISLLHFWGYIDRYQMVSFVCYIAFFFLQSLILSHRVYAALKQARTEAEQGLLVKSEFLSTMSHEIRTPLNAVIGMSHLLLNNNPRPDQEENLKVMLFSANNLLVIVNDILDYNKIEAGKITFERMEMDVADIAKYIVSGLNATATDKNIALKFEVDQELKDLVIGDPTRFTQVLTNLLHNAIKFTDAGYVAVTIEVLKQNATAIYLKVAVKDTGIGIPLKNQQRIFERFTQADSSISRSFGGTGLGLAISKRILELQDSSLDLVSEEGKGSVFYFEQLFTKGKKIVPKDITQSAPLSQKPFQDVAVLVVDDNMINVMVARKFLENWGATVDVAMDGQEALDQLDVNKHQLVLMDLHMPVMNGYEASKKMRTDGVVIPIIALTANLPEEIYGRLKDSGIDDVVVKPFLPDQLYKKICQYLNLENLS